MKPNQDSLNLSADFGSLIKPDAAPDGMLTHIRVSVIATLVLAVIVCGIYPVVVWGLSQIFFNDRANGSLIKNDKGEVIGSRLIGQSFSDAKYFHPRPSAAGSGYDGTASGGSNLGPTSKKLINGTTKPTTQPNPKAGGDPIPGPDAVDYDGIKLRVLNYLDENGIEVKLIQIQKDSDGKELGRALVEAKPFKTEKGEWDQVKLVNAFNDDASTLIIQPSTPVPADAVTASGSGLDPHISVENARIQIKRVADARKVAVDVVRKIVDANTDGADLGILGDPGVNVLMLNLSLDKNAPAPPQQK